MPKLSMRIAVPLIIFWIILIINACTYDAEETLFTTSNCNKDSLSYLEDIQPIIQNNCYQCHDNSSNPLGGGISVGTYSELKTYVESGTLICVINHATGCSAMPKGGSKLSDCKISQIENWITDGANEN